MGRIHVLPEALANQIAAGEVVERPAAAAKELLENAVDAGATAITLELKGGGVELLRVVDNGCGMSRDDAVLALKRHATSKLSSIDDLSHIMSLGFRGEAIPSIASVSRFTLRTRSHDAVGATEVRVLGGAAPEVRDAGGPAGTEVRVEDLFYNVPARRKFLKTPNTEGSHVVEAAQRLALCYPHVAFRVVKEGRTVLDLPRHTRLIDRVRAIFGVKVSQELQPVSTEGVFAIDGLIGSPRTARATARHYHTFINGRFVRDRVIISAVQAAYGHRLERGRHPFVVLRLTLPPEAVDVNVHPAKTEVRFVDTSAIHRLVARALDATLKSEPWAVPAAEARPKPVARSYHVQGHGVPERGTPEEHAGTRAGLDAHRKRIFDVMEKLTLDRQNQGGRRVPAPAHARHAPSAPSGRSYQLKPAGSLETPAGSLEGSGAQVVDQQANPEQVEAPLTQISAPLRPGTVDFAALKPLGTVADRFLLCAAPDGLVGLELLAARTRVAFNALTSGAEGVAPQSPLALALGATERARAEAWHGRLQHMGLSLAPFGGATYAVETLPVGCPIVRAERLVRTLLALPADTDEAALHLAAARSLAEVDSTAPEALLQALAKVERTPSRPVAFVFTLSAAELTRLLRSPA